MSIEFENSDRRFRILFENSLAVMLIVDPETHRIVAANNAAEKFYGWKRSDIETMRIDDINTLSPAEIEAEMEKARKSERIYFRFKHRLANGDIRDVEVYNGKVEIDGKDYLHSIIHDVSAQKEAVQEQIKSLNLLNNLAEQVPGVVYQYRLYPDGRSAFPYSSPGMWDIYEVTPEEVQEDASPVFTRIHPDDYDYIVETITESARNQTNYDSEFRVILPQQGLRWRHSNAKPELLEDGSTLWHGIITDVTERKKAEEALSHSHELMKYIIDHNQSAVAVLDSNLTYLYVSQRYLRDYRVKEKNIIGRHHYEVFPDIPKKWRKVHQKALNGTALRADEDIFYRKDGTFDWTRWECRPWYEADGSIGGIILYLEVISEQKRKEEEIRKLNQRLEILIDSIQQLSAAQSLDNVQKIVAKSARKLIGADGATLVFRENDHCFYFDEDAIQPLWKGKRFPMNSCISGWVMQNNKSVAIEDVFSDERIPEGIYRPTFVKSLAMVPVTIKEPIGAIGNYWKETYTPSETEMQLLQTLADSVGRAIENIQLNEELAENETQYRLLAENSGDVIFTLDFDLNFTYVSPAVYKLRNFTVDEVLQQNIVQTLTPDSHRKIKLLLDKMLPNALAGNQLAEPVIIELQTYKKDNSIIWVEVTATLLTNDKGKPTGILGVTRDISERKSVQDELRKLSRAVVQSPDSIVITDVAGNIEYVNPKFTEITGYKKEEVLSKNPRILNSGEHPKSFYKELWDTILAGNDWYGEIRNKKKNGELYWESSSISSLTNDEGEITHFVEVKEDITNRKNTEELLKYQTELQQILLKIASDYIHVRADDFEKSVIESLEEMGRFAKADRAYIFEYNWEKELTTNTHEWYAENIIPQKDGLQKLPVQKIPFLVEKHIQREEVFISDIYSLPEASNLRRIMKEQEIKSLITLPMMDGENCIGFVGFDWVKNHHEYSNEEKLLLSLYAQMLVNVKTRLTLEKTLIIEKDRAEAADRLKTAFLNNISHEVRTPLNGILGFGQMMAESDVSQNEKEMYLKILTQSSNRLVNTITDFMDISLIASGNVTVNKKIFPIAPLLNELGELYGAQCKEKGLEFELNLPSDNLKAEVESDPELLKKVFRHLLNNALKFTGEGNIKLGYALKQDAVECFVEDSGIGIEKEMKDLVFTHFTQEDTRIARGYEGSGLGLSIAKGLVEILGGEISLKSEKGKGTTASFTLPWAPEETEQESPESLNQAASGNLVLIAEDDFVNRMFIETILKGAGIQFISVENGREAVEQCRDNPEIGVVLMDLKMPVMDGYEATRLIKELKPELPVIAITAQAMQGDREKAIQAGCDDYIAKPFNKQKLLAIINKK